MTRATKAKEITSMNIVSVKWLGQDGECLPGVPARDLTPDEWAVLDTDQQTFALASGLYVAEA